MKLILAPLRGVTVKEFRNCLAKHFKGCDGAVAPFVPTVAGDRVKPALLQDIKGTQLLPVVPQIIGKDPQQLRVMLEAIKGLGYQQCDLNAGCPFPFIIKKGRGSGLLASAQQLEAMIATGCEQLQFSVKVRLGVRDSHLLQERMAILNAYPLQGVCIHPRTASQMYTGSVDLETFATCLALCRHPVTYNGDIRTPQDLQGLQARFPQIETWMLGRGYAIDPFLGESIVEGCDTRDPVRLKAFLDDLLLSYSQALQGGGLIGRFKELWSYLHQGLVDGERIWNSLKLCRTMDEYQRVVDTAFQRFKGFQNSNGINL